MHHTSPGENHSKKSLQRISLRETQHSSPPVPSRMDNTDRIRELIREIHDTEQTLAGLRAELARLVEEELNRTNLIAAD